MSKAAQSTTAPDRIPFRLHPRVFESLGSDLVTSDVVAVIELVKNSYDAYAKRVDVRVIRDHESGDLGLEVEDNGSGMSRSVIEEAWCVVATPYRKDRPSSKEIIEDENGKEETKRRRVSGEKGLGRLSAARLGRQLELITKTEDGPCWQLNVSWDELAAAKDLNACSVEIRRLRDNPLFDVKGTLVRIPKLEDDWYESEADELQTDKPLKQAVNKQPRVREAQREKIDELKDQLSRLISPFTQIDDFEITFTKPGAKKAESVEIKPKDFLSSPPYLLVGSVDEAGTVNCTYTYAPLRGEGRTKKIKRSLLEKTAKASNTLCGPFVFEIRVWDLNKDAATFQEISNRFSLNLPMLRNDIKTYLGLSLYRDGILILPKSETAKDWLGLDLRRVSKVGTRISTSQIVGYVAITAEHNPNIDDTSDRERLVDNRIVRQFKKLIGDVVTILENERDIDRQETKKEKPFKDLFASLSAKPLVEKMQIAVREGANASELLPIAEEYAAEVEKTKDQIEQRFFYYSRLASLGSIASWLVHEIRNQTTGIGYFCSEVRKLVVKSDPSVLKIEKYLNVAERGVGSLESLAKRLEPLVRPNRISRTRRRAANLQETIQACVTAREKDFQGKGIAIDYRLSGKLEVAVEPGDLMIVIVNLMENALYWLGRVDGQNRLLRFRVKPDNNSSRVYVRVDDSGPGVGDGDEERIFQPGVTYKNEGMGMGLAVASEIVAEYDGKLMLIKPGDLGGASFGFDLPVAEVAK